MVGKIPSENEYSLIGCSKCDSLLIVDGLPETKQCGRCQNTIKFKKAKKFFIDESREKVANARGLMLAERNNDKEQYKQLLRSGQLSGEVAGGFTDEEFLAEMGIYINDDEEDDEKLHEYLERQIKDNTLSETDLIERAVGEDFERANVEKTLRKMRESKALVETDGTLRFL